MQYCIKQVDEVQEGIGEPRDREWTKDTEHNDSSRCAILD